MFHRFDSCSHESDLKFYEKIDFTPIYASHADLFVESLRTNKNSHESWKSLKIIYRKPFWLCSCHQHMYFEAIYFTFNTLTSYCLQSYKNVIFKRFWLILPYLIKLIVLPSRKTYRKIWKNLHQQFNFKAFILFRWKKCLSRGNLTFAGFPHIKSGKKGVCFVTGHEFFPAALC